MQIKTTFFDVASQSEMEANQKLCYCMVKALFLDSNSSDFATQKH
jgi:hypothetical protein